MANKLHLASLLYIVSISICLAQLPQGGNPRGLDWQMLTSPSLRVIYPKGMEAQAQRIAGLINYIDSANRMSIGDKKKRLDMVLQNQTVNPNGYVGLGPFRSEFYSTPPQSNLLIGTMDWLDVLSIHEYRHALQYMNQRRGIVNLAYYLQGENAWSILNGLVIPNWFQEGDAVVMETALSKAGRGRSGFFTMEQRALAKAHIDLPYYKHRNYSYRDFVPDHYRLGYMMLTKVRNEKGNNVTATVIKDAAAFKGIFYPFSHALKKQTGYSTKGLYRAAWADQKASFEKQWQAANIHLTTPVTDKAKKGFLEYRFPCVLEDGSIIARKRSYTSTDEVVQIKDGKETHLAAIGYNNDQMLSYGKGTITWAEVSNDPRYANKDYSDVIIYDLSIKSKRHLTHRGRFFSPSISPDGKNIAAIHVSTDQKNTLCLLDSKDGKVLQEISTPKNYFLSRASWTADGNAIVTLAKHNSQLALLKINLSNGNITELTPWTSHTMEAPHVFGDKVYFNADYTGIDNIFATDLNGSKAIDQLTSVPVGAFEPCVDKNNNLVFTEFTETGYIISKQLVSETPIAQAIQITEPAEMPMFNTTANASEGGSILDKSFSKNYPSKPFDRLFQGMKVYNWGLMPSLSKPSLNSAAINLLRDVSTNLAASMNLNEDNAIAYNANLQISRYYTTLELRASQSDRNTDYYAGNDSLQKKHFNESTAGLGLSIPWEWKKGNFKTTLQPTTAVDFHSLKNGRVDSKAMPNQDFWTIQSGVKFSCIKRTAYQNVGSRLGLEAKLEYTNSFTSSSANKVNAKAKFYLPGLGKNHQTAITMAYQHEDLSNSYQYADDFEYSRGFKTPVNDEFSMLRAEYGLPLLYPDLNIAGITYIKRVRANLFYDYGIGNKLSLAQSNTYASAGFELLFDNTIMTILPMTFGYRQSYLLSKDPRNLDAKSNSGIFIAVNIQ